MAVCGLVACTMLLLSLSSTSKVVAASVSPPPGTGISRPAPNEAYAWRPVAIGGGGFITGFDSDPSGSVRVVRADVYGAYIWSTKDDRWVQLVTTAAMPDASHIQNGLNEGVFEIRVAPSQPDRIYMALKGNIYRSDDRGRTFALKSAAAPFPLVFDANSPFRHYGPVLAISPENPDLVLFGSPYNGVWRSQNGGETWSQVTGLPATAIAPGTPAPGQPLWFAPVRQGVKHHDIWVMVEGAGMFVSHDDGANFSPLSQGDQPDSLRQGAFAPDASFYGVDNTGKSLWKYQGGAWEELTSKVGAADFASVAINPHNGDVYVFDDGGRCFRSTNGGVSWTKLGHSSVAGEGDPPWLHVSNQSYFATGSVTFDPVVPNRLWIAAGTGVYYADVPRGAFSIKWISQSRGIEELVANDAIHPTGMAPLFAAWDFGIHVKSNLDSFSTTYGPKERVLIAAQQLDWSAGTPDFIVTNASDTRTSCCWQDGDAVLAGYSQDGGRTWQRFPTLPRPPGTGPDDPWRMAFGTIAVASNDTKNIVWEPAYNRAPYYTKDRGATWHKVTLSGESGDLTGSFENYYYARKTLTADRVLPATFYLVHSGGGQSAGLTGLWRTEDGGDHWAKVFSGEIAPMSQYSAKLRAVPGHAGHLFFTSGLDDGPDTALRRSVDKGEHWVVVPGVDHVDDIAFGKAAEGDTYPTIYLSGRIEGVYGIWRSVDNAQTWSRIGAFPIGRLDQVTVVAADPNVFGRVYVGYKGSGWVYGQPQTCKPGAYMSGADRECYAVQTKSRKRK